MEIIFLKNLIIDEFRVKFIKVFRYDEKREKRQKRKEGHIP